MVWKTFTRYAIENRFRVEQGAFAFKKICQSFQSEVNKHVQGEQGLSVIVHQKSILKTFLKENGKMKLNIRTETIFSKPEHLYGGAWDEIEEIDSSTN